MKLQELLSSGVITDIDECSSTDGITALHISSTLGFSECVDILLRAGSDANRADSTGMTSLLLASRGGHLAVINSLVTLGAADVNYRSPSGSNASSIALSFGHFGIASEMSPHRAAQLVTPLRRYLDLAIKRKCWEIRLASISGTSPNWAEDSGHTALSRACKLGHLDVVMQLLAIPGIRVNGCCRKPPIVVAARKGHARVVEELVRFGAAVNAVESASGVSALFAAAKRGHVEVVEALLRKGSFVDAREVASGKTPLFTAVENGFERPAEALLRAKANVNVVVGPKMKTPLILACENKMPGTILLLVRAGAKIDCEDAEKMTPLGAACMSGDPRVIQLLVKHGADVNKDVKGVVPLLICMEKRLFEVAEFLLLFGANPDAVSESRRTVLSLAIKRGQRKLVDAILKTKKADVNKIGRASCRERV
mgnify:CR=1 FL=1